MQCFPGKHGDAHELLEQNLTDGIPRPLPCAVFSAPGDQDRHTVTPRTAKSMGRRVRPAVLVVTPAPLGPPLCRPLWLPTRLGGRGTKWATKWRTKYAGCHSENCWCQAPTCWEFKL